jgi:hypothetical protein
LEMRTLYSLGNIHLRILYEAFDPIDAQLKFEERHRASKLQASCNSVVQLITSPLAAVRCHRYAKCHHLLGIFHSWEIEHLVAFGISYG